MNIDEILNMIDDMLEEAWSLPFSGGRCVVDAQKVKECIEDIRLNLPGEIKQAKMIVADRNDIIKSAERQAESALRKAEERARMLIAQEEIVKQAQEKASRLNLNNITFQQGDVGALPYENGTFDVVVSLNGFHAFPDKEAAYREVFRVLRPGGTFCGCFYVKGEHKRTDWFVRHVYEKIGFFTPPYETASSLKNRLERMYAAVTLGNVKSMAWFICRKTD